MNKEIVYFAGCLYRFTNCSRRRMAAHDVGDEDVVGRVDDEAAVLHFPSDAQEGEEADSGFHDDLLFILEREQKKTLVMEGKRRCAQDKTMAITSKSEIVTTDGATATLTSRH